MRVLRLVSTPPRPREVEEAARAAFPGAEHVEAHPNGADWYAGVWTGKGARIVADPRDGRGAAR